MSFQVWHESKNFYEFQSWLQTVEGRDVAWYTPGPHVLVVHFREGEDREFPWDIVAWVLSMDWGASRNPIWVSHRALVEDWSNRVPL